MLKLSLDVFGVLFLAASLRAIALQSRLSAQMGLKKGKYPLFKWSY
jgi:hypothetical protein